MNLFLLHAGFSEAIIEVVISKVLLHELTIPCFGL